MVHGLPQLCVHNAIAALWDAADAADAYAGADAVLQSMSMRARALAEAEELGQLWSEQQDGSLKRGGDAWTEENVALDGDEVPLQLRMEMMVVNNGG
jgi:hypothetical protein